MEIFLAEGQTPLIPSHAEEKLNIIFCWAKIEFEQSFVVSQVIWLDGNNLVWQHTCFENITTDPFKYL